MRTWGSGPGSCSLVRFAGRPGVVQVRRPRGRGRRQLPGHLRKDGPTHTPWSPFQSVSPSSSQRLGQGAGPQRSWAPARRVPRGRARGPGSAGNSRRPVAWAREQAGRAQVAADPCHQPSGEEGARTSWRGLQPPAWRSVTVSPVRSSRQPCEGRMGLLWQMGKLRLKGLSRLPTGARWGGAPRPSSLPPQLPVTESPGGPPRWRS